MVVRWRSVAGVIRTGLLVAGGVAASTVAVMTAVVVSGGGGGGTCTGADVTTGTFASRVTAATAGDVLCLDAGAYGTWAGTSKTITVKAATGQTPTMTLNDSSGSGYTIDGLTLGASGISGTASNVTIKNSTFTDPESLNIDGPDVTGIVVGPNDHFDFDFTSTVEEGGPNSKLAIDNVVGTIANPAVIVKDSTFKNGDLDGLDLGGDNSGTGSSGVVVVNNEFLDICQAGVNHTDYLQFDAATPGYTDTLIAGNWVHATNPTTCGTQTITSFDAGTCNVTIEDNVADIGGYADGVVLQGDGDCTGLTGVTPGSDVKHNTFIFYPTGDPGNLCHDTGDGGRGCGQMKLDTKVGDIDAGHAGNHTRVFDNVLTYVDANTSDLDAMNPYTEGYNLCQTTCDGGAGAHDINGVGALAGGADSDGDTSGFTTFSDYALTASSPGYHAADDGLSMGITGPYVYP